MRLIVWCCDYLRSLIYKECLLPFYNEKTKDDYIQDVLGPVIDFFIPNVRISTIIGINQTDKRKAISMLTFLQTFQKKYKNETMEEEALCKALIKFFEEEKTKMVKENGDSEANSAGERVLRTIYEHLLKICADSGRILKDFYSKAPGFSEDYCKFFVEKMPGRTIGEKISLNKNSLEKITKILIHFMFTEYFIAIVDDYCNSVRNDKKISIGIIYRDGEHQKICALLLNTLEELYGFMLITQLKWKLADTSREWRYLLYGTLQGKMLEMQMALQKIRTPGPKIRDLVEKINRINADIKSGELNLQNELSEYCVIDYNEVPWPDKSEDTKRVAESRKQGVSASRVENTPHLLSRSTTSAQITHKQKQFRKTL